MQTIIKNNISLIMAVCNGEKYLNDALNSVFAQTLRPSEIIFIDDGSTDNTACIAKTFSEITYYYKKNEGLACAQNLGVQKSSGNFLSFLDADDVWEPEKLALQMQELKSEEILDAVFGHVKQFISPDLPEHLAHKLHCPDEIEAGYLASCMLIRRAAFLKVGYFNPQFKKGPFIDWYMRATEQNLKATMLPDLVMRRRLHDHNMGLNNSENDIHYVHLIKTALDRRRKINPSS